MFDFSEHKAHLRYWARDAHGGECLYQREPWLDEETGKWNFFNGRVTLKKATGEKCEPIMISRYEPARDALNKTNPPVQSAQGG